MIEDLETSSDMLAKARSEGLETSSDMLAKLENLEIKFVNYLLAEKKFNLPADTSSRTASD